MELRNFNSKKKAFAIVAIILASLSLSYAIISLLDPLFNILDKGANSSTFESAKFGVSVTRSIIDLFLGLGFLGLAYSFGIKRLEL